jgi:hypothetical protein
MSVHTTPVPQTEADRYWSGLNVGTRVHHTAQRDAALSPGGSGRPVIGTVISLTHTVNAGTPSVQVYWDGPEGGLGDYNPNLLTAA